jgi:acyl dehydratase
MNKNSPVYLDDLVVGAEFKSSEHTLDQDQIIKFAIEFDPQPFHTDEEAAKDTFFKGIAASGWHTAAITMKLMVESLPFQTGIIGVGGEISWPRPTRPGETLRAVSKVLEIVPSRSKPDRGIVTVECLTLNQDDEVCQRFVTKLVVLKKPVENLTT